MEDESYDLMELGATILAMVHFGVVDNKCSTCQFSEGLSDSLNCTMEDVDTPVFSHEDTGVLYACPIRYITPDIYEYYDRLHFHQIFPGAAISYDDIDRTFWEFVKTYDSFKNKYESEKMKKDSPQNKEKSTNENMAMLRRQFLNKDK